MAAQMSIHSTPSAPVARKAILQPYWIASGPSSSGIMTAPIVPPLKDSAMPRARRFAGQRFDGRAQAAGERAAFAESEHGASEREAGEARHRRVRHARRRPHADGQQHADAQADVVEHRAPHRVAERVGEEEERRGGR